MAIVKTVSYKGQNSVSTLGGQIRLEEGRGRLVIYDPETERELTVVDRTGFLFSDATDRRIRLGVSLGRVGLWISKQGQDVDTLLGT